MFGLEFEWKPFSVSLTLVDSYINTLEFGSLYKGNSADVKLTLWFSENLTDSQVQEVRDYWDSITSESAEAANYVSQAQITARIEELKDDMLSKSWDEMSLVQRKILMGRPVSNTELGF